MKNKFGIIIYFTTTEHSEKNCIYNTKIGNIKDFNRDFIYERSINNIIFGVRILRLIRIEKWGKID